jgi:hypothetical protein
MAHSRRLAAALAALLLLAPAALADGPPSPLKLVPAEADVLVSVPDARRLTETVLGLEAVTKLDSFSAYREALDSTTVRHFRQFLAYYEKEMGAPWPQLLDDIAGGGAVVGIKFGKDPAPALLVVRGKDEKRVGQFARLAFDLLGQELARQDDKVKLTKSNYEGIEIVHAGDGVFAAVAGSAVLVSNNEKLLQESLKLHVGRGGKSCAEIPSVGQAAKLLPPGSLATLWLNLEKVKDNPAAAAAFRKAPRDDPALTILFGGYLDVVGRSPYLAAGLVREGNDFLVTVRMPSGRKGMGPDSLLHVPSSDAEGGRPLLQPKGVVFSTSFYLDVGRIWQDREKIFPEKVVKAFEKTDKGTNPFLSGLKISKILPQVGSHHRLVFATQQGKEYRSTGGAPQGAFAVVTELREPEKFGKAVEAALRGAALFAGFKVRLKLVEEKVGDVNLVGYRFEDEQPEFPNVGEDIFRQFSPCFARVGDQFLVCSSIDLGRELIGILQSEKKGGSPSAVRTCVFAGGVADYFQSIQEQLVTQAVLARALTAEEAAAEVKAGLALLRSIGPLEVDVRYAEDHFSYDFRLKGLK